MKKRALGFLLALCMLVPALPAALATENTKLAEPKEFTDVSESDWFYPYVQFVYEEELMTGTGDTTFSPKLTLDRAMVVQILYSYAGKPEISGDNAFSDVAQGAWYYDAVQWASANGVTSGDGKGHFNPKKNVSREEFAQFLYAYTGKPAVSGSLGRFPDGGNASGWAKDALLWAVHNGILSGTKTASGVMLNPKGTATRAEAAAMLKSFVCLRNSGLSISVDQQNAVVTDIHQSLSGAFNIGEGYSIQTITYSASNEDMGELDYAGGEVLIDETAGTWKLDDVQLLPGKNFVVVTAVDMEGNQTAAAVELTYDSGTLKEYSESEMTYTDEENGAGYINDVILVMLDSEATDEQRADALDEICDETNGEVVGQMNGIMLYQIQVERNDYDGLQAICDRISEMDGVLGSYCDEIVPAQVPEDAEAQQDAAVRMAEKDHETVTPNDTKWGDDWNENAPAGKNWWAEAVHAPSAWSHNSVFNSIKVGLVDGGVDTAHEDLDITRTMSDNVADGHGTHVAGIIGASANNQTGITGMVWNCQLYNYDAYQGKDSTTSSNLLAGVTRLVESGVKVVNYSNGAYYSQDRYDFTAQLAVDTIENLTDNVTDDFMIVQSAGNDCVDSLHNGTFCTLTEQNSSKDVRDHVIVVASVNMPLSDGTYRLRETSNYGSHITVGAPGEKVFSTVVGSYDEMSGTSMAAPVVTGIASMVWSVNKDFSAAEVKDIVVKTANTDVKAYVSGDDTTYHMVNADAAVEEAIARATADGNATGRFVDAATGSGLEVSYKVHEKTEDGEVVYSANSDSDGSFSFDLPAGEYVIEVNGELNGVRFITSYTKCKIIRNACVNLGDIPISTEVGENTYRVILEWGEEPSDLDSHLRADTLDGGSSVHVYYSDMTCDYANLDVDDTSSYGPETITVTDFASLDGFTYSVHNYSDRYAESGEEDAYNLAKSGAIVKVMKGNSLIATYEVPTNKAGTVWNVFSIDRNGAFTTLNTFEFESSPGLVGSQFVENAAYERRAAEKPAA